jgi:acyl-CoA thioesterase FadM
LAGPTGLHQDRRIDDTTTTDPRTSALTVTHRSTVTADQIDHLGHMNVRFYGVNAHAGTAALLDALDVDRADTQVVDAYTRHRREQLLGAPLIVRSGVLDVGPFDLRLYHELANEDTGELAATFVHRVRRDDGNDTDLPLPDGLAALAADITATIPSHGASRSIPLASDPIATAPAIAELRHRRLAMRKPRPVSAEECTADGTYVRTMAPMLVWGGEPVDRDQPEMLHTTDDGRRMGWASMETRLAIRRLPRAGERIQSFSAVLALADKTSHRILWAYDADREDLLVSFEIVNLAFDIAARAPMSIPDHIRAAETRVLHPELAPQVPSGA